LRLLRQQPAEFLPGELALGHAGEECQNLGCRSRGDRRLPL
jgi:hypothetical protein